MSQLLNKLTNLVVNKITDENLISGDSKSGSPIISVIDKDNDITYSLENYDAISVSLKKNSIQYMYICVSESALSYYSSDEQERGYIQSSNSLDFGNYAIQSITVENINGEYQKTFGFYGKKLLTYQGEESITIEYESDSSSDNSGEAGR